MDPSFLHADSEDTDQTGRIPRLILVFAGRTVILLVLSCRGSYKDSTDTLLCLYPLCKANQWNGHQNDGAATVVNLNVSLRQQTTMSQCMRVQYTWTRSCENVAYAICEQQRYRSACASAQSDQHLCVSVFR